MTNPIPAWWPKEKNYPMKPFKSRLVDLVYNFGLSDCLTAFKENMPSEKQWAKILTQSMFHDGTYLSQEHAEELSVAINARLMEGK